MRTTDAALEPIEKASLDELRALQLTRLKWSVTHAYDNVRSFRAKCEKAGAHPSDLKQFEDLARFPFTTKQDLRDAYPFLVANHITSPEEYQRQREEEAAELQRMMAEEEWE